jgi:hypothetical protein
MQMFPEIALDIELKDAKYEHSCFLWQSAGMKGFLLIGLILNLDLKTV